MLAKPTVLILGAGASSEFGFPLGIELRRKILEIVRIQNGNVIDSDFRRLLTSGLVKLNSNILHRVFSILENGMLTVPSIDDFIETHKDDRDLVNYAKLIITKIIHSYERDLFRTHEIYKKDHNSEFKNLKDNWLISLFTILCDGVSLSNLDQLFKNFSVINFNYDRSFEFIFMDLISRRFNLSEDAVTAILPKLQLYNPYGKIAPLSPQGTNLTFGNVKAGIPLGTDFGPEYYVELSQNILTYSEGNQAHEEFKSWLENAENIIFLGFGFHPQNLKLLEHSVAVKKRKIFFTRTGLSDAATSTIAHKFYGNFFSELQKRVSPESLIQRSMVIGTSEQKCSDFISHNRLSFIAERN